MLDDYHLVDSHEISEGMAFLLEHLPPHVHVVISTRADPDLPLARWRVRGELVEIRAADLRFTSDEAAAYLNDGRPAWTSPRRTSPPWRSGPRGGSPRCSSPRCRSRDATDASGFIARFAGDDRYIVDYLVEEVLRHQTDAVRGFLLQSAVLDRLTGPLCDAVTGRNDGSEMLIDAGARQPVHRRPGRPAGVVPLPPPVRRRAAGTDAQTSSRTRFRCCTCAPASGTSATIWPRRRSGTHWPGETSTGRRT